MALRGRRQPSSGNLIVADTFANKVESLERIEAARTGRSPRPAASPSRVPYDVTVADGMSYVADSGNKRIVELNAATGAYMGTAFGTANLHSPQGVAVDPTSGNIWVSDTGFNKLVEFPSTAASSRPSAPPAAATSSSIIRRTWTCTWTRPGTPTCTWPTSTTTGFRSST